MAVTRFLADMLYEDRKQWSFLLLGINRDFAGSWRYLVWTLFAVCRIGPVLQLLCFGLFGELVVCWMAMNYLTAIKDYKGSCCHLLQPFLWHFCWGFYFSAWDFRQRKVWWQLYFWILCNAYLGCCAFVPLFSAKWRETIRVFSVGRRVSPLAFTGLFVNLGLFLILSLCGWGHYRYTFRDCFMVRLTMMCQLWWHF